MTIRLPNDLEDRMHAAVRDGRFATIDDAMAEAARLLVRDLDHTPPVSTTEPGPDLVLGSMHEAANELDEVVADVYRQRREEAWRDIAVE